MSKLMLLYQTPGGLAEGEASPPPDPFPSEAFFTSAIPGINGNASVAAGSTTFGTDDYSLIQGFLNTHATTGTSANPFFLVVDMEHSLSAPLRLRSHQWLYLSSGKGLIITNNANCSVIENYGAGAAIASSNYENDNIRILGPGIINANGYNSSFPSGAQIHSTEAAGLTVGVKMFGVTNFVWNGPTILRARTYAFHGQRLNAPQLLNGVIDVGPNPVINMDGIHFNGPVLSPVVDNWTIHSYDDAVAFNADDGLSGSTGWDYYGLNFYGPITNLICSNIVFDNSLNGIFGIRLLSGSSLITGAISNISGVTKCYAILIDNYWQDPSIIIGTGTGNVGAITIDNINVAVANHYPGFAVNQGIISLTANISSLTATNVVSNTSGVPIVYKGAGYTYGTISVNGTTY